MLLGVIALVFVLLSLYEAGAVWGDPETYERVHHVSPEVYAAQSYRSAAFCAIPLVVSVLMFVDRKRRRLWRALNYVSLVIIAVMLAYGWLEWAATGYDH